MAMVRAAIRGGPLRTRPSSNALLFHSPRHSSSVLAIAIPQDSTGHYTDIPEFKAEPCGQNAHKGLVGSAVKSFLKEQRGFLIELQCHLKDQRLLLNSIREELGLQKIELEMRKELIDDIGNISEDASLYSDECKIRKEVSEVSTNAVSASNSVSALSLNSAETIVAEKLEKTLKQDSVLVPKRTSGNDMPFLSTNAVSTASLMNAETIVSKQEVTSVPEGTSGNDVPSVSSEEKVMNGDLLASKEADTKKFQHPSWPEWTVFLNHLRPYASVKEKPNVDSELFDDTTILKRALVKFAQAHEGTFRSLSRKDLRVLVENDLPSMDDKTATGRKKLQVYLETENSTEKRTLRNKVSQAKLTDVVRLVYRAVRSIPALNDDLPIELKEAVLHILEDLNSAGVTQDQGPKAKLESAPAAMSQETQERNQEVELDKVDEGEGSGNINTLDREASSHDRNTSIDPNSSTSETPAALNSVDSPKFGSLKERVDARRERLAKESLEKGEKEAGNFHQPPPPLTEDVNPRATKKRSVTVKKRKDDHVVTRNFEAFDAIIESDDVDDSVCSRTAQKPVSRASDSSSSRE